MTDYVVAEVSNMVPGVTNTEVATKKYEDSAGYYALNASKMDMNILCFKYCLILCTV